MKKKEWTPKISLQAMSFYVPIKYKSWPKTQGALHDNRSCVYMYINIKCICIKMYYNPVWIISKDQEGSARQQVPVCICIRRYRYTQMCIYVYVYMYIHTCIHITVYMYICTNAYVHIYTYIYVYIHIPIYIYIYTYIYIYIHTYIYIYTCIRWCVQ